MYVVSKMAVDYNKTDEFSKWYNRSLKLLSLRPRSIKEIRDYLLRKKTPEVIITQIVAKLVSAKLLDDDSFAEWFVENRQEFRPKSTAVLRGELYQRGISREIVKEVFLRKFGTDVELKGAYSVAGKKWRILRGLPQLEKSRKLQEFLWRKGYSQEIVRTILERLRSME